MSILYFNRYQQKLEQEKVYGENWIRACYNNPIGFSLTDKILASKKISAWYGSQQNSATSAKKIPAFIKNFSIPMDEFDSGPFHSFNDFFIRKFLPGKRPFVAKPNLLAAPAEGRYLGFSRIDPQQTFPIKGKFLSVAALMDSYTRAQPFINGPCLIARLCPVDYHRFHFPDAGKVLHFNQVPGKFHSVNPVALAAAPKVFCENERTVTILETKNFGKLLYLEVGALMVGKIIQSHTSSEFQRGDEKGYFLFGASTVILFGEPGAWQPSADILENTALKREVFVRLGDEVGLK